MWTIILLDHNGHREEQELPILVPLIRKPISSEGPNFRTKEYKLSCHDAVNRKAIYLEVI